MKRSDELKRQIADLTDSMEALVNKCDREGRDMSAAEQSQWHAAMAKDTGKLAVLTDELHTAVEAEDARARLRSARASTHTPPPEFNRDGSGPYTGNPQPQVRPRALKAFNGGGDKQQAMRDAYDCGLWIQATLFHDGEARQKLESRRGMEWLASQNESSPVDGGYLVPAPMQNAILASREQVGAMRRLLSPFPMTADTLKIPKRTGGLTVYYPGEEGEITPSDADYGAITLTAKKRAVLTYISSELRDDSLIPIVDEVTTEMGHALALKEDQEGIVGDGTSTYGLVQGIRPAVIAATASVFTPTADEDAWDEITFGTFAGCMSLLPDKYRVPGQLSWLCSSPFKYSVMDRLAIGANGALSQVFIDGVPQDMFLGYPIVLSDRMPTTTAVSQVACIFGNFPRAVAMGERTGVRVALSEHVAFTSDRIAMRATVRYDINVHEEGDTSTAGAIVGLSTHS